MPHTPRISVLMPAYNVEKYVGEAIESILNQTFTDFEFIIINDGSTDNTAKIIQEYAKQDKRIRFIDNKKNQGLIAVLNQGLDLCTGEYIARMDSDDISLPERFEKQIKYMDEHPECGVVGGFGYCFFSDGAKGYVWKKPEHVLYGDLLNRNPMIHPTVLMRKSVLDEHNIKYSNEYKHAEDYALWADLINCTQLHNIPEIVLHYRCHGNNVGIVYHDLQYQNSMKLRTRLKKSLTNDPILTRILTNSYQDVIEEFYLFGLIPFIRIKRYGEFIKTKYYIFSRIPLLTIKGGKIYLFEIIRIGVIK